MAAIIYKTNAFQVFSGTYGSLVAPILPLSIESCSLKKEKLFRERGNHFLCNASGKRPKVSLGCVFRKEPVMFNGPYNQVYIKR